MAHTYTQDLLWFEIKHGGYLFLNFIGSGHFQVNFVHHRNYGQLRLECQIEVSHGLCLDSLVCIHK